MDNFLSFRRFTSVNPNIAEYGATVEEFVATRGKPDPNPVVGPMADTSVSNVRLALTTVGSDRLRVQNPSQPFQNPYEGPKRTTVLSRNAVTKLKGKILDDLRSLVKSGAVGNAEVQGLMDDSLNRVNSMRDLVGYFNGLAELVEVRAISASKP
jgi:hypothetical protein